MTVTEPLLDYEAGYNAGYSGGYGAPIPKYDVFEEIVELLTDGLVVEEILLPDETITIFLGEVSGGTFFRQAPITIVTDVVPQVVTVLLDPPAVEIQMDRPGEAALTDTERVIEWGVPVEIDY